MRNSFVSRAGAAFALLLASTATAQFGSGGTITSGGATFTLGDNVTSDTSTALVTAVLSATAVGNGTDQLYEVVWLYRVNGVDFRELRPANASSWSWAGNAASLTYNLSGFNLVITWTISDPTGGGARVDSVATVTNTSGSDLSIDLFCYVDIDFGGAGGDSAVLSTPDTITITDPIYPGASAYFRAANATAYQVQAFAGLRTLLYDAGITDLFNSGLPFGPADFTGAWQFTRSIPVGQSAAASVILGLEPPAPIGRCCVGDACSVTTEANCSGSWTQGGTCPVPGYNLSGAAGAFEDISGTGSISTASFCDDCGQAGVPIGFNFTFYENTYTTIGISSNGFLSFGATLGTLGNTPFPTASVPNDMIAPFWDDLNPNAAGSGDVFYQTLGDPGSQRFIVQWNQVYRFGTTLPCTFQVVLFEGTNNIEFRYLDLPALGGTITPNMGVENSTGTVGLNIDPPSVYPTPSAFRIVFEPNPENPCASACTADFNNSGAVTVQDIYDFLTDWSSQSTGGPIIIASADFNGVNGVTVQDLYDYFTAWNTQISDPTCN